jgi:hypothetical protein
MKLIFLDIDGVLNNQLWYSSSEFKAKHDKFKDCSRKYHDEAQFDPRCVHQLNEITDKTKAKIVVSSSWRLGREVEELKSLFSDVGIKGEVIGKTPYLSFRTTEYNYSVPRGCEIKAWIEMNKDIIGDKISKINYVILDDDSDMLYWQRDKFLWVDPYSGLTHNTAYKAINILTR